jgi:hypothetical protein
LAAALVMEPNRPHITPQGVVGVFIVLLGIVFTLDNLGLVQSHEILQYWPLAPIGIGLLIVIHAEQPRDWIRGTVWLGAGALFLAQNLGWIKIRLEAFWPMLLVAFGLHIIFRSQEKLPNRRMEREQRRMARLQARMERRTERWHARHGDAPPPWGEDWARKWQEKWQETQSKFREDWQKHAGEDWQDKLKHTIQSSFSCNQPGGKVDVNVPMDVNVPKDVNVTGVPPGATSPGANPGATGAARASATASGTTTGGSAGTGGFAAGAASTPGGQAEPTYGGYGWTSSHDDVHGHDAHGPDESAWQQGHRFSMFALMGGVKRQVIGVPFRGATMTAVMGGVELDLRQATLPDDAVIELFAFWGGIEIVVPRDWIVVNQGFALMGGVEDKTGNLPRPGGPRLYIRGMALMGGVEIKNPRI